MKPEHILKLVPQPGRARLEHGQLLYEFITSNRLCRGLELNSGPNILTAYLAGALDAIGGGSLQSMGDKSAKPQDYNIREALRLTSLSKHVYFHEQSKSHNWRLMQLLQHDPQERFDFCFIDGGRTWSQTGLSCCLVEKLLVPGGWIILDNLNFCFRESMMKDKLWVTKQSEEEQTAYQLQYIYELLLQRNAMFQTVRRRNNIGWAQKRKMPLQAYPHIEKDIEVLIDHAVERARHDPEFRHELLSSPIEALSQELSQETSFSETVSFVETDIKTPLPNERTEDGTLTIYLDRPAWEHETDEDTLEALLGE